MKFHTLCLVLIWAALGFSPATTRADAGAQGEAVVRLLNLFAARADPLAVTNAGKRLAKGESPAQVVASDLHLPVPSTSGWCSPETTRLQAKLLGEYVAENIHEFAGCLPDAGAIHEPLRLEAFFSGLFLPVLGSSSHHFEKDLAGLSSLLDESWLEAAGACGSEELRQRILVHRGGLRELLHSYQEAEDDTAVIVLGETLANWSAAYRQVSPGDFAPRTLALLLAGSLGAPHSHADENVAIVMTAGRWIEIHPAVIDMLRDMRDPAALRMLEVRLLWQIERTQAMKRIAGMHSVSPWNLAGFTAALWREGAPLPASEAMPLIGLLPSTTLEAWSKRLHPAAEGGQAELGQWIDAELASRNTRATPTR